jgi:hypothetical protein
MKRLLGLTLNFISSVLRRVYPFRPNTAFYHACFALRLWTENSQQVDNSITY